MSILEITGIITAVATATGAVLSGMTWFENRRPKLHIRIKELGDSVISLSLENSSKDDVQQISIQCPDDLSMPVKAFDGSFTYSPHSWRSPFPGHIDVINSSDIAFEQKVELKNTKYGVSISNKKETNTDKIVSIDYSYMYKGKKYNDSKCVYIGHLLHKDAPLIVDRI